MFPISKLQTLVEAAQKLYKENQDKYPNSTDYDTAHEAVTTVLCTINRTSDILELVACNIALLEYEGKEENVLNLVSNLWDCTLTSTTPAIYLVYNIYWWIFAQVVGIDLDEAWEQEISK